MNKFFLTTPREIVKNIEGINIKFHYPRITDEINIEAEKALLTRGQYPTLSMGFVASQKDAVVSAEEIATLKNVAQFIDEDMKDKYWDDLVDNEGKEFLDEVYDEYIKWRDSFRRKDKESDPVT